MVKHTHTIRWQKPTNCLSVFDDFVGLALKGLKGLQRFFEDLFKEFSEIFKVFTKRLKNSMQGASMNL